MRVLVVHRYFWPDSAPQATILRSIGTQWARDGHDVTVFSAQPSYTTQTTVRRQGRIASQPKREALDGVTVIRTALLPEAKTAYARRATNYVAFFGKAAVHILRGQYDVVMGLTAPPVMPGVVLGAAARRARCRYVYYCVDIHPEISHIVGLIGNGLWFRALRWLDGRSVRRSAAVVVISDDMQQVQLKRGARPDRLHVIRECDLEEFSDGHEPLPSFLRRRSGTFRLLFTGNLGRFQDLPTIIEAALQLGPDSPISFEFLGTGLLENELRASAGELLNRTVFFHRPVSAVVARLAAEEADACIVSLSRGVVRYAFPAKLVSYLRAGAPVVAVVDGDSSLAAMVRERGLGVVSEPGHPESLVRAVKEVMCGDLEAMSRRSKALGRELYSREPILAAWSALGLQLHEECDRDPSGGCR